METVAQIFRHAIAEGVFTHGYAACGRLAAPGAQFSYSDLPDGRFVFDLASLTKALVTTVLVYKGIVSGQLALDLTLQDWLGPKTSERLAAPLRGLTIRSLLRHESGLPAWRNFWVNHLSRASPPALYRPQEQQSRLLERLNDIGRVCLPTGRAASLYSDIGFLLLGLCLELAASEDLAKQFTRLCTVDLQLDAAYGPLGYGSAMDLTSVAVPTAYCAARERLLIGEVHDENCASLGGVAGHAGLFGSGPAVGHFLTALAGTDIGRRLLQDNARALVLPLSNPANEALLGWRQGADPASAPFGQGGAMGHLGFTGVAFWVCPQAGDYAILLTNRVSGGRTKPGIAAVRRAVFTALARAQN